MSIVKNFPGSSGSSSAGVAYFSVSDTDTVNMSVSGTENIVISSDVIVSSELGNQLEARSAGLFVPAPVFSQNIKIDFYDTVGAISWNKPAGSVMHDIFMIGGGGGGSAGFVRYTGNNGVGGGGGAPGCIIQFRCLTQYLASVVSGFVGDGGAGGVGNLVGVTQNPGANGQNTTFGAITAQGGIGGPISSDASGRTNGCILFESTFNSGGGGVAGVDGAAPSQLQRIAPTGGGSGGGATDASFRIGGNGGAFLTFALIGYPTVGVLGGQTIGAPGSPGITLGMIGLGGGGGAGVNDVSADGGNGGDGGLYGGGGGGGGSASAIWLGDMTKKAGSGGKGGRGCIMVISYIE